MLMMLMLIISNDVGVHKSVLQTIDKKAAYLDLFFKPAIIMCFIPI